MRCKFLALPMVCRCSRRLGSEARLYRAMFLEETGKDYVRTARAKGLSEPAVLFRHVLRNALIPIITSAGSLPAVRVPRQPGVRELLRHSRARRLS